MVCKKWKKKDLQVEEINQKILAKKFSSQRKTRQSSNKTKKKKKKKKKNRKENSNKTMENTEL